LAPGNSGGHAALAESADAQHGGVPPGLVMALMFAVFTVAAGYGLLLPLLGQSATEAVVSRHTGLLTGVYTLAIFLFAPLWGWLSDRHGRRRVLLLGLLGFGASMLAFSLIENLPAVYAERFVSGLFAAAVTPVAAATVGDLALSEEVRARRLTFVSLAGVSGVLLGPMLGVFISRYATLLLQVPARAGELAAPLTGAALLALLAAAAIARAITGDRMAQAARIKRASDATRNPRLVSRLLVLAFIVAAGIGVFEVGLALRGTQELSLTRYQLAVMFTECSLVMIVFVK
jgi:MFS family permease